MWSRCTPLTGWRTFQQAPLGYPYPMPPPPRPAVLIVVRVDAPARQDTLHPRGGTPADNPFACFVGVSGRERTPLPRHQEAKETTKELRRVSHPFHVSDHRGAIPVAEVAEADLRIFPDRAGIESAVITRDLTVDPHLFVPTQFVFDARYQHRFVISIRHTPMARYRYDVVRKILQRLDHDVLPNRRVVIDSSPSVLGVRRQSHWGTTSDSNSRR